MRRRDLVGALAAAATAGPLAGCLDGVDGTGAATPTPVALSGEKQDDRGGMVIGRHGGPNGQIFYAEQSPAGHDGPAWFHTLAFGLFPYYFEHREMGWEATAIYATDYSTAEYEVASRDGRPVISAPTDPETFGNARELTYVAGSDVRGGMGPALVPFSESSDADDFVAEHGGRTMGFDDVTPGFLASYTR